MILRSQLMRSEDLRLCCLTIHLPRYRMNIFEKEIIAVRNRKFASRLKRPEHQGPKKRALNHALQKIISNFDSVLTVNSFERFLVENSSEFDEQAEKNASEKGCQVNNELKEVTSFHQSTPCCNTTLTISPQSSMLDVDELSIVTPVKNERENARAEEVPKNERKYIKSYRELAMAASKTPGQYTVAKYKKNNKRFGKRLFVNKHSALLYKMKQPSYRRFLAVKYPKMVKLNLHKFFHVRQKFLTDSKSCKSSRLSKPLLQALKKWEGRNLSKIEHNPELLRELAFSWSSMCENHFKTNGLRLSELTVESVDILATAVQVFIRDQIVKISKDHIIST